MQLHLKLCWSLTVRKLQEMIIDGIVVVDVNIKESFHGVSHASLNRVRKFTNIGLQNGNTRSRLFRVIKKSAQIERKISKEKHLSTLCENHV